MSQPQSELLVLVVDDNPANRLVLTHVIEMLGGAVREAEDGLAALHALQDSAFHLVLMDIAMPVMDGIEATRQMRSHGLTCPIVAVTAHMGPQDLPELSAAGFDRVIQKPISVAPIAEAMQMARA